MAAGDRERLEEPRQARDVMAFGQEVGRVLSDGRIVGRAEPFAKVFPSSRAVKRAVGLVAWAILEDIALDARLDDRGRLVSETNVRRIAANLGVSKNTVTGHLARLREFGFVLREELRDDVSGRYEQYRYVLDPSACIERFTVTPRADAEPDSRPGRGAVPGLPGPADEAPAPPTHAPADDGDRDRHAATGPNRPLAAARDGQGERPRPKDWDTGSPPPRPKNWDTGTASQFTGHGALGQNKEVVVERQQQPRAGAREAPPAAMERLLRVGVAPDLAETLVARYPPERVAAAVRAADRDGVRNPSGFVASALREGWELSEALADERAAEQRRRRRDEQDAADAAARSARERERARAQGWAAAISAALDDRALAQALAALSREVAGWGAARCRRPAPS